MKIKSLAMISLEEILIADSTPAPVLQAVHRLSAVSVVVDSLVLEDAPDLRRRSHQKSSSIDSSAVALEEWVVVALVRYSLILRRAVRRQSCFTPFDVTFQLRLRATSKMFLEDHLVNNWLILFL